MDVAVSFPLCVVEGPFPSRGDEKIRQEAGPKVRHRIISFTQMGAVFPGYQWSIPMFRADFLHLTSKSVHIWPNLPVAFQIHCQGGQNNGGIGLVSMTNGEVDAIQVQNTPMWLQRTLPPDLKLVGQALVETTDRAGDFERLPSGFA